METVLKTAGIILGSLLVMSLGLRSWRWTRPSCGCRRLQFVGLASEWSAEWVESRFPEGHCGACGRYAFRRAGVVGRWEPARHAEPGATPDRGRT